ncbi:MAG: ATP-grasp domain-containing protein [Deltaproteobacteria bacterium]|nr:ATP-grasp domain-containing protein [Deltaproteobacteria bacterium]
MKALKVLMLMHADLVPPDDVSKISKEELEPMKTEHDVYETLTASGHTVMKLGVRDELGPIRSAIYHFQPDIAFNLLEEFDGQAVYDQHVVSYLELARLRYTGCNPRGLVLARDKALAKKILHYHRVAAPEFIVYPHGQKRIVRPKRLQFPLFVKSLVEEASLGISQASLVDSDEKLKERVRFIHEKLETDALVERYIEGRELYVGVLGSKRLQVLPVWELCFDKLPEGEPLIATRKAKWDTKYQKKLGITSRRATQLPPGAREKIERMAKRIYRLLSLSGYARIDFRLTDAGDLYFLEANPNPQIAKDEDFAESAAADGMPYDKLLDKILALGMSPDGA